MQRSNLLLDRFGAIASGLCAVHCLLTSLLLGALSVLGLGFIASRTTEYVFIGLAVLVGLLAGWNGWRKHGNLWPMSLFALGLVFIFSSHYSSDSFQESWRWIAGILAVCGGLILVSFHFVNAHLLKKSNSCSVCRRH